jgi:hypothetical protein
MSRIVPFVAQGGWVATNATHPFGGVAFVTTTPAIQSFTPRQPGAVVGWEANRLRVEDCLTTPERGGAVIRPGVLGYFGSRRRPAQRRACAIRRSLSQRCRNNRVG